MIVSPVARSIALPMVSELVGAETPVTVPFSWTKTAAGGSWTNAHVYSATTSSDFSMHYVINELTPASKREHIGITSKAIVNQTSLEVSIYTGLDGVFEDAVSAASATWIVGDVARFEKTGTTVKVYQNGILRHTMTLDSAVARIARVGFDQVAYINKMSATVKLALTYVGGE